MQILPTYQLAAAAVILMKSAGFTADLSSSIRSSIQPFVESNVISGAVTLVAHEGDVMSHEAVGWSDLESRREMRKDDLFWIASMTKPVTAVAILMLQDEGRLSVDDPVSQYLPEFSTSWMIESKTEDRIVLKRPSREITLFDLLTHTSGVAGSEEPRSGSTLGELVAQISQLPLEFEPGNRWQYSNSGINTLGRIVEVVSGMSFEGFLETRLFRPLGMKNTTFVPTRPQLKRLAKSYSFDEANQQLREESIYFVKGDILDESRTVKPAGGLFSTAEDMFRFYQMILNKGTWNGRRLVSKDAVLQMTKTQTGDIKTGFTEGMSWGLGFQVVKEPQGVTEMLTRGTFGHGGAYGTQSWADPNRDAIYILMIQRKGFPNGDASPVRHAFQTAAAESMFQ